MLITTMATLMCLICLCPAAYPTPRPQRQGRGGRRRARVVIRRLAPVHDGERVLEATLADERNHEAHERVHPVLQSVLLPLRQVVLFFFCGGAQTSAGRASMARIARRAHSMTRRRTPSNEATPFKRPGVEARPLLAGQRRSTAVAGQTY